MHINESRALLYRILLLLSLYAGILGIQTSLSCGVLAIRGHNGPLVNYFSAFSDALSLKVAKLLARYPPV
jgi:hypothetical protein